MRILITGATGFVGRHLVARLSERGHELVCLTRHPQRAQSVLGTTVRLFSWQPESAPPPQEAFENVGSVVHLAGENVAARRWTEAQKRRIRDSRVLSTRHLVQAIQQRRGKPLNVISASAIGFYGNRGEELLTEHSAAGQGFLAEVCRDWEKEAKALPYGRARLVIARIGVVLGHGGMLEKLLPIFRLGIAGPMGSGKQWMSWIHIHDLVSMLVWALENPAIEGVINAVGPKPATNAEFTRRLGEALRRPTALKVPAFGARLVMGEMADLAFDSQRVIPEKPQAAGFTFRFPELPAALSDLVVSGTQPLEVSFSKNVS